MRFCDLILSLLAAIIFLPIFIVVIPILRFTGEGEVFFAQERVGQNGELIKVLKFATMLKRSPEMGAGTITQKNDPRVLPVGKFLRKSKINELPQLINVLIGEMSLVGPRPHAARDLQGIEPEILEEVVRSKPGITGIASIIFRDEEKILHSRTDGRLFYDQVIAPYKAELELWYSRNKSLKNYFIIIFLTLFVICSNNSGIIFRVFISLPSTPERLAKYFL